MSDITETGAQLTTELSAVFPLHGSQLAAKLFRPPLGYVLLAVQQITSMLQPTMTAGGAGGGPLRAGCWAVTL